MNPKSGDNAGADDPNTWGEFDQAVRHWEAHRDNGIAGVGFEFSPGDPYAGVDLDKCRNPITGEIEPWALADRLALQFLHRSHPRGYWIATSGKRGGAPGGGERARWKCTTPAGTSP